MHRSKHDLARVTVIVALVLGLGTPALAAEDLAELSLEELMNLTVTSVSRRAESRGDAAAAITLLTSDDIRRSGATSIPEVLRLVPGLNVARIDSSRWAISARGYNNQFANKLLVLIDGRIVYTPLFGGVYWDIQDVVMEDIDRIEVIRGPGGTLWGANAVNGVINIITKNANDTQGVLAMGLAGNQEYIGEGRYGGMVGENTAYRVYARGFQREDFDRPDGMPVDDDWYQWRIGGRVDSQLTDDDYLTFQGDFYQGESNALVPGGFAEADTDVIGGNFLTRWTHTHSEKATTTFQFYYDRTDRNGATREQRNSLDLQVQNDSVHGDDDEWLFNFGTEFYWTGDALRPLDPSLPVQPIEFDPEIEDFYRFSGFLQLQWQGLDGDLVVTAGTKLEYNNYTDFEYQPTGRVLWKFVEGNAVWAAISRAVRTPSRVDRDITFITQPVGNKDVGSEDLVAYELGYRNYMLDNVTFDLALFYNDYTKLLAFPPGPPGSGSFENLLKSYAYGGEVELGWQPLPSLRFTTSYAFLRINDETDSTGVTPAFGGNETASPRHTWLLRALWSLPWAPVELDGAVWYVSDLELSDAAGIAVIPISDYWRLDLRAAWEVTDWLALELVGQNLTDALHQEYDDAIFGQSSWVPRSGYGKVTLTF